MKTLLIYEQLVSLNREAHRGLHVKSHELGFSFASGTNSVPLAAVELPQAALHAPCVFIEAQGGHTLAALLGLRDQENLFVNADGQWADGAYLPAFFRRYPFVLAEADGQDELTVCIDEAYPGLNRSEGHALFDDQGQETEWLEEIKRFLVDFRQQMLATRELGEHLAGLGLLEDATISYELSGERRSLTGFKTVSESRLRELPAEALQSLMSKGWLGLVYAHLLSLNQVQRLAQRLDRQIQAQA